MYTGKLPDNFTDYKDLHAVANMYGFTPLQEVCEDLILYGINKDNFEELVRFAHTKPYTENLYVDILSYFVIFDSPHLLTYEFAVINPRILLDLCKLIYNIRKSDERAIHTKLMALDMIC